MKQTKQQIIEGLTADLFTEKSHNLKMEEKVSNLEKEVHKFQQKTYDAEFKVKEIEEQIRAVRTIANIDRMAIIKSSMILLDYNGDENSGTHRQKKYHTNRAKSILQKEYDELFGKIFSDVNFKDLPF